MSEETDDIAEPSARLLDIVVGVGVFCLLLSSLTLYFSVRHFFSETTEVQNVSITYMLFARLCGITAFCIGVYCIFNQRWTAGALLLLGSIVLPFISLFVHGTM